MPRPPIRDPRKDPRALLGRALKRLRVAAGYTTQAALAARLNGHGEDSVQKAETGYQLPTDDLILRWLDTCEASSLDRELIADLVEHAREAEPIIPSSPSPGSASNRKRRSSTPGPWTCSPASSRPTTTHTPSSSREA